MVQGGQRRDGGEVFGGIGFFGRTRGTYSERDVVVVGRFQSVAKGGMNLERKIGEQNRRKARMYDTMDR